VHAYTSPHLARFHERIRLAGDLITEAHLTEVLDECYRANDGADITYFEITTCAALLAFARTPADYTLLEVGLGGRLDATNVVDQPELTIITPVSMDHEQYLGDTIAKIAGEKAGIIKRGVPCIVGPQHDDALAVIEARAERLGAPILAHGQHWHVGEDRGRLVYQDETGLLDLDLPNLPGAHQIQNVGMALAALRHLNMPDCAFDGATRKAVWPARMQHLVGTALNTLAPNIDLWLDGGHNPAAGQALAAHLGSLPARPTHLICGMLNTKDVSGYLSPLAHVADGLIAVSIPGETNTLTAAETAEAANAVGLPANSADSVATALTDIAETTPHARVLICGSLYLAGHVLRGYT
jgi:dihydrofolate synthase/folylpolyglutamate synthase